MGIGENGSPRLLAVACPALVGLEKIEEKS